MHSPKTRDVIARQHFVRSLTLKEDFVLPLATSFGARSGKPSFATESFATAANSFNAVRDSSGNFSLGQQEVRTESPVVPTEGKLEGYVDGGSLVSFVHKVSEQQRKDVLYGCNLAQLAASAQYDRVEDSENWYKAYTEVMENIGWVVQNFQFEKIETKQSNFKLSDSILEILSELVGGNKELWMC